MSRSCAFAGVPVSAMSDEFVTNWLQTEEPGAETSPALLPSESPWYEGTTFKAFLNGVFVDYEDEAGERRCARAVPGNMYINGSLNMLTAFRTNSSVQAFFHEGLRVRLRVAVAEREEAITFLKDEWGNDTAVLRDVRRLDGERRLLRIGSHKQDRVVSAIIVQMWSETMVDSGGIPVEKLGQHWETFDEEQATTTALLREIQLHLLSGKKEQPPSNVAQWFAVSYWGPEARSRPKWPKITEEKDEVGIVKAVLRPHGGIIELLDDGCATVYFHRSRLLVDGKRLGYTTVLEDEVSVGDKVTLTRVSGSSVIDHCPAEWVAVWVHKGKRAQNLPSMARKLPDRTEVKKANVSQRLKVTHLIADPCDGRVHSGVAIVYPSSAVDHGNKDPDGVIGRYCHFQGKDLSYSGFDLEDVDLNHFVKLGSEMHGILEKLTHQEQEAIGHNCTCKVVLASLNRISKENVSERSGLPELLPAAMGVHHSIVRRGLSFPMAEQILYKRTAPLGIPSGLALASVVRLNAPVQLGQPTTCGVVRVLSGPHKDRELRFTRDNCQIYKKSMASVDMTYLALPYDWVYVDISNLHAKTEENKAVSVFFGRADVTHPDPVKMTFEERQDLLSYLERRGLSFQKLEKCLEGALPPREFIPFPRSLLHGRVISLQQGPQIGAEKGIIKVEQGYAEAQDEDGNRGLRCLVGEKVRFDRDQLFAFGMRCDKADLAHILARNQKIMLEAKHVEDTGEQPHHGHNAGQIVWQASLTWVGPCRPRNDRDVALSRNDEGVKIWLKKRNLSDEDLEDVLLGNKVVSKWLKDDMGFALPQDMKPDDRPPVGSRWQPQNPIRPLVHCEPLPVLKHGPEVANMVEAAIMAAGPSYPLLSTLICDDDLAQKAYHICQALKFAVDYYKEKKEREQQDHLRLGRLVTDRTLGGGGYLRPWHPRKRLRTNNLSDDLLLGVNWTTFQ